MKNSGYILGGLDVLMQHAENQKSNRYWTLIYVRAGIGMYILDGELRALNEGDIILFPPVLEYSFSSADLGDEYNINIDAVVLRFDQAWLDTLLSVFHGLGEVLLKVREIRSAMYVSGLKWLSVSSLMNDLRSCEPARQARVMLDLLECLSTGKDMIPITRTVVPDESSAEKVKKIERFIDCNIYRKISLDEISSYLNMNRTYFCLFFKKKFGTGLTEYINERRINKASAMLAGTGKPIGDIAVECGFKTVNYFNRIFRNVKGLTPGEYRKKAGV